MRSILVMMTALVMAMAAVAAAGSPAEARAHKPRLQKPHVPRPHKVRAPKSTYRTVRIRRSDGTTMTGYRDSMGTHIHGPDGRTIHCQRQTVGAADIDVACH
jgi:hypothetical protein